MKKLFIAVLLTLIGLAFTAPAFAVEHQFGGYWRVRMYTQEAFSGDDSGSSDQSLIDTRTRLYYTAVINDNLKLVNKFEMDARWGNNPIDNSYGDIGADGVSIEVKQTYADFNLGALRAKVGTQGATFQRGFIFADEFSGAMVSAAGVTATFMKIDEAMTDSSGDDAQAYVLSYVADLGMAKLTPTFTYWDQAAGDEVWYLGLDVDATLNDMTSLWGTFIYNGGEVGNIDVDAWLAAAGGKIKLNDTMNVHGQVFYASGDDNAADNDQEAFVDMPGNSYYWSEIMGLGVFDFETSNGSPGDSISNIIAVGVGVTIYPMEKLKVSADLWYAERSEELVAGLDEELGFEVDLMATYQVVEGLNLDVVAAYLFAGDTTTGNVANDDDPYEIGTRLTLSF